jgi:nitrogen regulatory protein P-II 1
MIIVPEQFFMFNIMSLANSHLKPYIITFISLENMKRVEAVIASEKVLAVNDALKKAGIGGLTVIDAKGRGKGEKPMIETGRGTRRLPAEFSVRASVIAVVQDSEVDKVIKAILDIASTGAPGDGKIFISTVAEAVDIGSKKRGQTAIE